MRLRHPRLDFAARDCARPDEARRRLLRVLGVGLVVLSTMATEGCGRRGRLLPPTDPDNPFALPPPKAAADTKTAAGGTSTKSGAAGSGNAATSGDKAGASNSDTTKSGLHRRVPNPPILPPKQPFILDPLL